MHLSPQGSQLWPTRSGQAAHFFHHKTFLIRLEVNEELSIWHCVYLMNGSPQKRPSKLPQPDPNGDGGAGTTTAAAAAAPFQGGGAGAAAAAAAAYPGADAGGAAGGGAAALPSQGGSSAKHKRMPAEQVGLL